MRTPQLRENIRSPILREILILLFFEEFGIVLCIAFLELRRKNICMQQLYATLQNHVLNKKHRGVGKSTAGWSEDYEQLSNDQPAVVATSRITIDNDPGYS